VCSRSMRDGVRAVPHAAATTQRAGCWHLKRHRPGLYRGEKTTIAYAGPTHRRQRRRRTAARVCRRRLAKVFGSGSGRRACSADFGRAGFRTLSKRCRGVYGLELRYVVVPACLRRCGDAFRPVRRVVWDGSDRGRRIVPRGDAQSLADALVSLTRDGERRRAGAPRALRGAGSTSTTALPPTLACSRATPAEKASSYPDPGVKRRRSCSAPISTGRVVATLPRRAPGARQRRGRREPLPVRVASRPSGRVP
jgi:hypothetical protein